MTGAERYDFAILGGGCAGLSLAVELVEQQVPGRIAIVEPREHYVRDRTWCYWDVAPHRFQAAVARRFSHWELRHGGRVHRHGSRRFHYCEIPGDAFYEAALARLEAETRVDLLRGVRAEALDSSAGGVLIETDRGALRARMAFDSRPDRSRPAAPLLQHFQGLRVRIDRPAFEPGVATLMDLDVPQSPPIHFAYVLPSAEDEALVESTFFSATPLAPDRYRAAIESYLKERHGVAQFEVRDEERGVIPMDARRVAPHPSPDVLRIGTPGGLVKPSTGYAFLAIQQASRALAAELRAGRRPGPPVARDRVARALDALFLEVLGREPGRGPALFEAMFERVPADALVRFLSDVPSARDRFDVMRSLPTWPFLKEAWRSRARWSRA